jgi:hypothetical protein
MENQKSLLIDQIVGSLGKYLEKRHPFNPSGRPRAPNRFDEKLCEVCRSGQRNILLDTGFQAWFAYIQAHPVAQAAFDELPDPDAKIVAHRLCAMQPHPTVKELFQHMLYVAFRGWRRRG